MKNRILFLLPLCFLPIACLQGQLSEPSPLPRTVVTLYDGKVYPDIWYTRMHQYAEMPLNHLGVKLDYYDLRKGLPDIKDRSDVIGVLVWFPKYTVLPEPEKYLQWAIDVVDSGKKFVIMGTPGFYLDFNPVPFQIINAFWNRLGLQDDSDWVNDTYEVELLDTDSKVVDFERPYHDVKPPYEKLSISDDRVTAHLVARQYGDSSTDSVLVATGPNGGYTSEGYEKYEILNDEEHFRKWYINPFEFFTMAYGLSELPKPDTTTLAGRRIYYSHIDGDGWNSLTELEKYRREKTIAAEVIFHEIILPLKELPVTVAPIVADIDPNWIGNEKSRNVAVKIFEQPHVEVSSHTYTHPFFWKFFERYAAEDETPYLGKYHHRTWKGNPFWLKLKNFWKKRDKFAGKDKATTTDSEKVFDPEQEDYDDSVDVLKQLSAGYEIPRAYAIQPFNLVLEVQGSVEEINRLAPKEKPVALYQWSGDCQPFEEAIKMTRDLKLPNINGGDTRFDPEFLSYSWVMPLGRQVGQYQQIYASSSNENTYTNLWRGKYYGFNLLPQTLKNTETPLRIKPLNVYYHMYSGEKLASLNALKQNLEYIRSCKMIPITTSRFTEIVEGFYTTKVIPIKDRMWRFEDRGKLQTIRFDRCTLCSVDFSRSEGVVGEHHFQGSLYVYLDESHPDSIVALKESSTVIEEAQEEVPYLIESRWRVWNLQRESFGSFRFLSQGYGKGEMRWKIPTDGNFEVIWKDSENTLGSLIVNSQNRELKFVIDQNAINPIEVTIQQKNEI